jgi:hypothetical protein
MTGSNEPITTVVTGTAGNKDPLSLAWRMNAID